MELPRPSTIFRLGGLVACANVALPLVVQAATRADDFIILRVGVDVALAVLFGVAFWLNTSPRAVEPPLWRALALFGLQVLIAVSVTDYFFIVAATAPLVFAPRGALTWLGLQLALFVGVATVLVMQGTDISIPEVTDAPRAVAIVASVVYVGAWQVFAFTIGYLAAGERRSHDDLQRGTRDLLATQQMLAESSRVAERVQISRELHDTLGHNLTVLNVNLEFASHLTDGRAAEAIGRAQTVGRLLLADVREVVHSLGSDRPIDLPGALRALADGARSPAVHLTVPEDLAVSDAPTAHALFRCAQEAVTNAARHAEARTVWVTIARRDEALTLHVHDDGRGSSGVSEGHGLQGMRERLAAVGGTIRIQTAPGDGFTIDVSVPCA
jgi:signal transduction histidine kinase